MWWIAINKLHIWFLKAILFVVLNEYEPKNKNISWVEYKSVPLREQLEILAYLNLHSKTSAIK